MNPTKTRLVKALAAIAVLAIVFIFVAPILGSAFPPGFSPSARWLGDALFALFFLALMLAGELAEAVVAVVRARKEVDCDHEI